MKKGKQKKQVIKSTKNKRNTFSKKLANELREVLIEAITAKIVN